VVIGLWDMKFLKKDIRHLRVIVLAGMDKDLGMLSPKLTGERGAFDKLGPGTYDRDDFHEKYPLSECILGMIYSIGMPASKMLHFLKISRSNGIISKSRQFVPDYLWYS
jgi:hypothetical protein